MPSFAIWCMSGIGLITLLYALYTCLLAWKLKSQPRPYPLLWSKRYMHHVSQLRIGLFRCMFFLAPNAVLFLIPLLLQASSSGEVIRTTALFGGEDVLCMFILYMLWKWTGRLLSLAALYHEYAASPRLHNTVS